MHHSASPSVCFSKSLLQGALPPSLDCGTSSTLQLPAVTWWAQGPPAPSARHTALPIQRVARASNVRSSSASLKPSRCDPCLATAGVGACCRVRESQPHPQDRLPGAGRMAMGLGLGQGQGHLPSELHRPCQALAFVRLYRENSAVLACSEPDCPRPFPVNQESAC